MLSRRPARAQAARNALRLGPRLPAVVEGILDRNAWHYTVTGAHRGGGLDSTIIIEKTERMAKAPTHRPPAHHPPPTHPLSTTHPPPTTRWPPTGQHRRSMAATSPSIRCSASRTRPGWLREGRRRQRCLLRRCLLRRCLLRRCLLRRCLLRLRRLCLLGAARVMLRRTWGRRRWWRATHRRLAASF